MANLGTRNDLRVLRLSARGATLDGADLGEVLLPHAQVAEGTEVGSILSVFLYQGFKGEALATTLQPRAQVGEVACLRVKQVKDTGAFLDWGLPKDLLLPWGEVPREAREAVVEGRNVLVAVFRDAQGRVAASARVEDFLESEATELKEGERVTLVVAGPTDLGMRVVVNHRYWGLIHASDIFGELRRGETREGFVKALRFDRKLDISLHPAGYQRVGPLTERLLALLVRRGGFLPLTDKSPAEEVYAQVGMSKKAFKQTLGALYRERRILLEPTGIRLV